MDLLRESSNEIEAFSKQINVFLGDIEILKNAYIPLNSENFFERLRDGVIIAHLIDLCFPSAIQTKKLKYCLDLSQINTQHSKVLYEVNANLDYVIECAKSSRKLVVVNVGPADILDCNKDIVLGLVWQLLSYKITMGMNIQCCPALLKLANEGETLLDIANMKKEALLVRWINYHLQKSECPRTLKSFGKDLSDCVIFAQLLGSIFPSEKNSVDEMSNISSTSTDNLLMRAELLFEIAQRQNISLSVMPTDIISGNPRLQFAFAATIFNHNSGIYFPTETEIQNYQIEISKLSKEIYDLRVASELRDYEIKEQTCILEAKIESLNREIVDKKDEHEKHVASLEAKFEENKKELAQQYRDSMLESITIKEQEYEKKLALHEGEISEIRMHLQQTVEEIRNISENSDRKDLSSFDISSLLRELDQCTQELRHTLSENKSYSSKLESELEKKENLNSLMGSKIKEYAEQAIHNRKSVGRRSSLITKMFSAISNQ